MSERNPYLISKSFRTYLVATILATMSTSLGIVLNSVVVGNVLGPNELSAVGLVSPLIQLIAAINALINVGGATLLAINIGKGKLDDAQRIFTVSMMLSAIATVVLMILGFLFINQIANALCKNATLYPMVYDYARIALIGGGAYLFLPALCVFVRTDSAPKLTTVTLVAANVISIFVGFVLMCVFKMGIVGSGLGTIIGYLCGIAIIMTHFRKESMILKLKSKCISFAVPVMLIGLPVALSMGLTMIKMFSINSATLATLGTTGATILAVCMNVLMLASMFVGGTTQTLQPVGGTLYGSEDLHGVSMVVKLATKYLVTILVLITAIALVFPQLFLVIFGVSDPSLNEEACRALRIFSLNFLFFGINYLLMVVYQVFGNRIMSLAISAFECVFVVGFAIYFSKTDANNLWWAFFAGESLALIAIIISSEIFRRKDHDLERITLTRKIKGPSIDISVSGNSSDLQSFLDNTESFLVNNGIEHDIIGKTRLCCEELVMNIMQHGLKNDPKRYLDVIIRINDGKVNITLRDDGEIFDPVEYNSEGLGIPIARNMCSSIKYSRNLGQNNVFITI